MKLWVLLIIFLLGLGVGLILPSVTPKYLDSYFPKIMKSSTQEVKGVVVRKKTDPNRLLLTISSKEGALLATFQKKIAEISLLVDEGDTLTLAVKDYAPFVTDPPILRVKKPEAGSPTPASPSDAPPPDPEPMMEASPSTIQESPLPDPPSP
jgi:hypothetical protein